MVLSVIGLHHSIGRLYAEVIKDHVFTSFTFILIKICPGVWI